MADIPTWTRKAALAEHYKAIGQINLSLNEPDLSDYPWHRTYGLEYIEGSWSIRFVALDVSGLNFTWNVDLFTAEGKVDLVNVVTVKRALANMVILTRDFTDVLDKMASMCERQAVDVMQQYAKHATNASALRYHLAPLATEDQAQ